MKTYRVEKIALMDLEKRMNEFAEQGWKVIQVLNNEEIFTSKFLVVLEKEKDGK